MALLDNGKVSIQGKLSDIKSRYRSREYQLETENSSDTAALTQRFPAMKSLEGNRLVFSESDISSFDVLSFVSDKRISLLKFERMEPTLESLFMEVTRK